MNREHELSLDGQMESDLKPADAGRSCWADLGRAAALHRASVKPQRSRSGRGTSVV